MMNNPSLHVANTALHFISLISSVIILILLLCIRCMNSNISFWRDHVIVFYLLMFIAWSYFMDNLIFLIHDYSPFPCNVSNFFQLWLSNQSTMLFSSFALLIWRRLKLAILYWSIPSSVSLILALVSSLAFYSTKSESQCTWYDNDYQIGSLYMYLIPQLLCIFFNIGVVIYILVMKCPSVPANYLVYPFIPLVSQLGTIVNQITLDTTRTQDEGLRWWAYISNGLGGLFVLLVFLMDPLFWQGMDLAKCTSLWSTTREQHSPNDENMVMINDTSTAMLKATMKTNSMASSMTTQNSTLSMTIPDHNESTTMTIKEKQVENTDANIINVSKYHRPFYQPSLSPNRRDAPIIIFPPPPTISPTTSHFDEREKNPTSIELDESDFIGMFSKPDSLHVDTTLSATYESTTSIGLLSPPSPALLLPVCYEMEDAVPWRVLEADEEDEEDLDHNIDYYHKQQQSNDSTNITTYSNQQSQNETMTKPTIINNKPPRYSSLSASTSGYRKESWLSLDDDYKNDAMDGGIYDEEKAMDRHHSMISSSSPSTVSEWLTRRGDSLDGVREQMGRTSKSIRRWCRNVNRQQQDDSIMNSMDDGPRPTLHVVHEELPQ